MEIKCSICKETKKKELVFVRGKLIMKVFHLTVFLSYSLGTFSFIYSPFALMQEYQKIKAFRHGGSNGLKFLYLALTLQNHLEKRLVVEFKKRNEPKFLNAI